METDNTTMACAPLSAEEESAWELMVEEGRKIRSGRKVYITDKSPEWIRKKSKKNSMTVIPIMVKRWVILRMAGISFKKAGVLSGATWLEIQEARAHSEEFRCALEAQEENSRQLMRAKAQSVVEQSQEEDAKVSLAQTQLSMRILESLDREHFGEERVQKSDAASEAAKALGGGGFVINLIQDAAKSADTAPERKPGKALVYTNV